MNTSALIRSQLLELGVDKSSALMVHASLKKIGPIQGGPNELLNTILEVLPNKSALVMPLGSNDDDVFDAEQSPAEHDIGALAEIFRCRSDTFVSDHVAGRFGAIGERKEFLLEPTPLHDYLGPGSLLDRFTQINGSVLRIGADLDTVTLTHYAEYLADIPNKKRIKREYVRADTGHQVIESLDDCDGIIEWSGGEYFSQIFIDFAATGQLKVGNVGAATAEIFSAEDFIRFAVHWLELHCSN